MKRIQVFNSWQGGIKWSSNVQDREKEQTTLSYTCSSTLHRTDGPTYVRYNITLQSKELEKWVRWKAKVGLLKWLEMKQQFYFFMAKDLSSGVGMKLKSGECDWKILHD